MALANQRLCYLPPLPNLLCPFSRRLFEQQCLGCHLLSHLNPSMLLYILYIRYCYNGEFAALAFAWSVSIASCVCVCHLCCRLWFVATEPKRWRESWERENKDPQPVPTSFCLRPRFVIDVIRQRVYAAQQGPSSPHTSMSTDSGGPAVPSLLPVTVIHPKVELKGNPTKLVCLGQ